MDLFMIGFMYVFSLHILQKTNSLCDFHGVSGETFFYPQLKIEYVEALVFFMVNLDEPWVFNPPRSRIWPTMM
jgi:hypothetical protein